MVKLEFRKLHRGCYYHLCENIYCVIYSHSRKARCFVYVGTDYYVGPVLGKLIFQREYSSLASAKNAAQRAVDSHFAKVAA